MARPDFVCIGAQKAGTTWLYGMLAQNPGVFLPPVKEIHFFDHIYLARRRPAAKVLGKDAARDFARDFRRRAKARGKSAAFRDYFRELAALDPTSDAWYARVFEHPRAEGRITGEITPAYSILPVAGVERARAINPGLKVILIIRDPVDRALSHLRMLAGRRGWRAVDAAVLRRRRLMATVSKRSAYRKNIARWETVFPAAQMLYLAYPRIRPEPEAVLREVEAFIGADPWSYAGMTEAVHRTAPLPVAPEVAAALERRFARERAWIARRFGAGFLG